MKYKILALIGLLVLGSCSTKKEILYFQGIERLENMEAQGSFEPIFEINDILYITVTSEIDNVAAPYQMRNGGSGQAGGGQQNPSLMGYLIDIDGFIQFPGLGRIKAAGKSRSELEAFLTVKLKLYITDVVVAVRLLNFRVTVIGETGETVVNVENERITVPELIASVGGIPYSAKRDNILVIREIAGERTYGYVDMTSVEVFENPYYYLRQNDIVYVEPTLKTVKSAGWITSPMGLVSVGTTIFSLIILFTK